MPEHDEQMVEVLKSNQMAMVAVAEVLQKVDNRIEAAETAEMQSREAQEEDEMRKAESERLSGMIKSAIQEALPEIVKTVNMELNGDSQTTAREGTPWPMSANPHKDDETEEKASMRTQTSEVQKPIQAMEKEDGEGLEKEHKDKDKDKDKDVEEEYPMEEKAGMMMRDKNMANNMNMSKMWEEMQAEVTELRKQNVEIKDSVEAQVKDRMSKMGYHEEQSRTPKLLPTSGFNEVPIIKAEDGPRDPTKVADDLSELSWNQLWNLRIQMENGNTDGVPKELIR